MSDSGALQTAACHHDGPGLVSHPDRNADETTDAIGDACGGEADQDSARAR